MPVVSKGKPVGSQNQALAQSTTAPYPLLVTSVPSPTYSIILKGRVYNTAYAGAGADVFAADITPTYTPTTFRVNVTIDTAVTCVVVRDDGVAEMDSELNAGTALTADAEFSFDISMTEDETFNLEFGGVCQILYLVVLEIPGGS